MAEVRRLPPVAAWIALLLMLGFAGLAYAMTPRTFLADTLPRLDLERVFPRNFGGWTEDPTVMQAIVNPQVEAAVASIYTDTLGRTYMDAKGNRMMLSVAYGRDQSGGSALHYPEVCYPAQGLPIEANQKTRIMIDGQDIEVRRLVAGRPHGVKEYITYWVIVGDKAVLGRTGHSVTLMEYGLQGYIPDGVLMRVSSIGEDETEYERQRVFMEELLRTIPQPMRGRLEGTRS